MSCCFDILSRFLAQNNLYAQICNITSAWLSSNSENVIISVIIITRFFIYILYTVEHWHHLKVCFQFVLFRFIKWFCCYNYYCWCCHFSVILFLPVFTLGWIETKNKNLKWDVVAPLIWEPFVWYTQGSSSSIVHFHNLSHFNHPTDCVIQVQALGGVDYFYEVWQSTGEVIIFNNKNVTHGC